MTPAEPTRPPRRGGPAKRSGGGKPPAGGRGKPPAGGRSRDNDRLQPGRPRKPAGPREPIERTRAGRPVGEERLERDRQAKAKAKGWGGVARKGAGRLDGRPMGQQASEVSKVWRAAVADERGWKPEEWIDEGDIRKEATKAVGRAQRPEPAPAAARRGRQRKPPPADPELAKIVGPDRAGRFSERMRSAADHFQRGRYDDARKILRPLADSAPTSASLRELYGLTLYRLGKWRQATAELESFRALSDSTEQHPVLADCYRAQGRHKEVEALWEELRTASPSAELVAEGRIVMAGSLADQDRLEDAIRLLQRAKLPSRRPQEHHLRVAYALADLYERAGETPKARELFMVVATSDDGFADVRQRLRNLS